VPKRAADEIDFSTYRRTVRKLGLGIELYLAHEPLPEDAPVYVLQHTTKTAGTSLRALLFLNLTPSTVFDPRFVPNFHARGEPHKGSRRFYREWYEQLSDDETARMQWVIAHSASHAVPYIERPVRGLTIVRHPVDRTLSRFWFASSGSSRTIEELSELFAGPRTIDGSWLDDPALGRHWTRGEYSNFQSRWLLAPHHDISDLPITPDQGDADAWRERLLTLVDETYTLLLLQERLDDSARVLAERFDWEIDSVPTLRLNKVRPRMKDIEPELRGRIEEYNWLDLELYRQAVARFGNGPEPAPERPSTSSPAGTGSQ
jgi:hypothetical protein